MNHSTIRLFIAKHSPLFLLAGLCLLLAILSDDFRSAGNLKSVAGRTSEIGIIAVGQLLVIITGGIDLSVGSVAALGGVTGTMTLKTLHGLQVEHLGVQSWWPAILLGTLVGTGAGLLAGCINGLLVTKGRIPPFIATLGMMMVARGAAFILSGGMPITGLPAEFGWLGGARVWWIPVAMTLGIALTFAAVLNFTRFGRGLYATGGNLTAARLSGLSVDRIRMGAYMLSGTLAGFAGVILASRLTIGTPTAGEMYELESIAACVIGGASLMGGEGSAPAALAGALIMVVLRNYCNLENINVYWQQVFVGSLVIVLVFYDNYRKRRAGLLKSG